MTRAASLGAAFVEGGKGHTKIAMTTVADDPALVIGTEAARTAPGHRATRLHSCLGQTLINGILQQT